MNTVEYFGLNEQPFRIGPDPRYLFYSGQVKEAIAKCEYMARDRVGPIYMYGPIGSGKTSILRRLTERLGTDEHYTVRQRALRATVPSGDAWSLARRVTVVPDALFTLSVGEDQQHFLLELDRGTGRQHKWGNKVAALTLWVASSDSAQLLLTTFRSRS